jgi:short-subunit dehydrogenase
MAGNRSSRGLGRALAEEIFRAGDLLVADIRNATELRPLARRFGNAMRVITVDIRSSKQVESVIRSTLEAFGRLDVLINNAKYGTWDRGASFYQITFACPEIGTPDLSGYFAVKAAIERLSDALALEVRKSGINVWIVEVGALWADMAAPSQASRDATGYFSKSSQILQKLLQTVYSMPGDKVTAALARRSPGRFSSADFSIRGMILT